jgi:hypothetical protein
MSSLLETMALWCEITSCKIENIPRDGFTSKKKENIFQ